MPCQSFRFQHYSNSKEFHEFNHVAYYLLRENRNRCHFVDDMLDVLPDDLSMPYLKKMFVVAIFNGETPLGAALVTKKEPTLYYIEYICTLNKCKGAGVALMRYIIKLAQINNVPYVGLTALKTVMGFYNKLGMIRGWPTDLVPGRRQSLRRRSGIEPFRNIINGMPYYVKVPGVPNAPVSYTPINIQYVYNRATAQGDVHVLKRLIANGYMTTVPAVVKNVLTYSVRRKVTAKDMQTLLNDWKPPGDPKDDEYIYDALQSAAVQGLSSIANVLIPFAISKMKINVPVLKRNLSERTKLNLLKISKEYRRLNHR